MTVLTLSGAPPAPAPAPAPVGETARADAEQTRTSTPMLFLSPSQLNQYNPTSTITQSGTTYSTRSITGIRINRVRTPVVLELTYETGGTNPPPTSRIEISLEETQLDLLGTPRTVRREIIDRSNGSGFATTLPNETAALRVDGQLVTQTNIVYSAPTGWGVLYADLRLADGRVVRVFFNDGGNAIDPPTVASGSPTPPPPIIGPIPDINPLQGPPRPIEPLLNPIRQHSSNESNGEEAMNMALPPAGEIAGAESGLAAARDAALGGLFGAASMIEGLLSAANPETNQETIPPAVNPENALAPGYPAPTEIPSEQVDDVGEGFLQGDFQEIAAEDGNQFRNETLPQGLQRLFPPGSRGTLPADGVQMNNNRFFPGRFSNYVVVSRSTPPAGMSLALDIYAPGPTLMGTVRVEANGTVHFDTPTPPPPVYRAGTIIVVIYLRGFELLPGSSIMDRYTNRPPPPTSVIYTPPARTSRVIENPQTSVLLSNYIPASETEMSRTEDIVDEEAWNELLEVSSEGQEEFVALPALDQRNQPQNPSWDALAGLQEGQQIDTIPSAVLGPPGANGLPVRDLVPPNDVLRVDDNGTARTVTALRFRRNGNVDGRPRIQVFAIASGNSFQVATFGLTNQGLLPVAPQAGETNYALFLQLPNARRPRVYVHTVGAGAQPGTFRGLLFPSPPGPPQRPVNPIAAAPTPQTAEANPNPVLAPPQAPALGAQNSTPGNNIAGTAAGVNALPTSFGTGPLRLAAASATAALQGQVVSPAPPRPVSFQAEAVGIGPSSVELIFHVINGGEGKVRARVRRVGSDEVLWESEDSITPDGLPSGEGNQRTYRTLVPNPAPDTDYVYDVVFSPPGSEEIVAPNMQRFRTSPQLRPAPDPGGPPVGITITTQPYRPLLLRLSVEALQGELQRYTEGDRRGQNALLILESPEAGTAGEAPLIRVAFAPIQSVERSREGNLRINLSTPSTPLTLEQARTQVLQVLSQRLGRPVEELRASYGNRIYLWDADQSISIAAAGFPFPQVYAVIGQGDAPNPPPAPAPPAAGLDSAAITAAMNAALNGISAAAQAITNFLKLPPAPGLIDKPSEPTTTTSYDDSKPTPTLIYKPLLGPPPTTIEYDAPPPVVEQEKPFLGLPIEKLAQEKEALPRLEAPPAGGNVETRDARASGESSLASLLAGAAQSAYNFITGATVAYRPPEPGRPSRNLSITPPGLSERPAATLDSLPVDRPVQPDRLVTSPRVGLESPTLPPGRSNISTLSVSAITDEITNATLSPVELQLLQRRAQQDPVFLAQIRAELLAQLERLNSFQSQRPEEGNRPTSEGLRAMQLRRSLIDMLRRIEGRPVENVPQFIMDTDSADMAAALPPDESEIPASNSSEDNTSQIT